MLRRYRRPLAPLLAVAALLAPVACRRAPQPVAEVAGKAVPQDALKRYLTEQPQGTDPKAALEDLVRMEVAWVQAERAGLLNSWDWREAEVKIRQQIISQAFLESLPGFHVPTEASVRNDFFTHSEQRHVLHLLVHNEEEAKAARHRLEQGEAFEKVAQDVSLDPSAKQSHGDIGWITRDSVVPEFAKAVFSAPVGSLCGPFRSEYGWHVALVKEVRSVSQEDFEKMKGGLLAQAREMALKAAREDVLKTIRTKYPLTVDEGVLSLNPSTAASAEVEGSKVVGQVCGEPISLRQLLAFIKEAMGPGGMDHGQNAETRKRFLELCADENRLCAAAGKAGITKRPEVQANLWLTEHKAVKNGFGRDYLLKLKPADADLSAFYTAHRDTFKGVGAVKVYLMVISEPTLVGKATKEARSGEAWKTLVARYANKESTGNWNPGFLPVKDLNKVLPENAVKALTLAPLETVIGPLDGPEGQMLFKILDRKPGEILPLDQCRDQVRMAYLDASGEQLLKAYLDGAGRAGLKIKRYEENLKF